MAIAFDAFTDITTTTGTSLTYSHTTSGSDRGLVVMSISGGSAINTNSVTYNSVSMTDCGSNISDESSRKYYLWTLIAPATGSNNVVVTMASSTFIRSTAASYTGVNQTTLVDGVNTGSSLTGTTPSINVTSTVADTWGVAAIRNDSGNISSGTNLSPRGAANSIAYADSNGSLGTAGTETLGVTTVGGNTWILGLLMRPATSAGPTTVKTWDGVTQSTGVKTYFGVDLANVKTVDGAS